MSIGVERATVTRTLRTRASALAAGALLASLAGGSTALAQDQPPDEGWKFTLAPYLMGASLSGDAVVRGQAADVDVSAGDIFDNLDWGFMAMAAARKGNWGVVSDTVWVKLSVDTQMPPGEFEPNIGLLSVSGVRRLSDYADATLGVRWNHVNARLRVDAPVAFEVERSRNWFDPVLGVVLRTDQEKRFHATLITDVGGFGVGSDFTWQIFPTVGVKVAKNVSVDAGWRFLSVDYKTGEGADRFEYDILYQGPVVGVVFRF
jgi:hypothetical protein